MSFTIGEICVESDTDTNTYVTVNEINNLIVVERRYSRINGLKSQISKRSLADLYAGGRGAGSLALTYQSLVTRSC